MSVYPLFYASVNHISYVYVMNIYNVAITMKSIHDQSHTWEGPPKLYEVNKVRDSCLLLPILAALAGRKILTMHISWDNKSWMKPPMLQLSTFPVYGCIAYALNLSDVKALLHNQIPTFILKFCVCSIIANPLSIETQFIVLKEIFFYVFDLFTYENLWIQLLQFYKNSVTNTFDFW